MSPKPDSDLVAQFLSSMVMDYEKWREGIGYDLEAIDRMDDAEKASVEATLMERGISDWRDLEALERLNTPSSIARILLIRKSPNEDIRLYAHRYGPKPEADELESAILAGLASESSKSKAMDRAAELPTRKVILALLNCARNAEGSDAYKAVATLYYIHGKIDSPFSWQHRPFFLRFVEPSSPDREAAFQELCKTLNL